MAPIYMARATADGGHREPLRKPAARARAAGSLTGP
jgi:hypothetical protein